MFKKTDARSTFRVYVYCLYDKLSCATSFYQVAENDSKAILNILSMSIKVPLKDCTLIRLGVLDSYIPTLSPEDTPKNMDYVFSDVLDFDWYKKPVLVDWSACKLPESEAESLAPLGLSPSEVKQIVTNHLKSLNVVR